MNDDDTKSIIEIVKEYIPDPRYRIRLDDLVTREIRKLLTETSDEIFPVQTTDVTTEEFVERLNQYEYIIQDIQSTTILLSHWGTEEHRPVLRKIMARGIDEKSASSGGVIWLTLRYYPSLLLLYSGGISAIFSGNYENLFTIFNTTIGPKYSGGREREIIKIVVRAALELERTEIFKTLPGYERFYVPKSEYLYKALQPILDDLLFLGNSYESIFDRFEAFLSLVYADLDSDEKDRVWGPPGRFAYKHRDRGNESGPFFELLREAKTQDKNWPPLKAGFFRGSYERFQEISANYEQLIGRLNWF